MAQPERLLPRPALLAYAALATYAVLLAAANVHHAFLFEEAQAWLIARDSHGLLSLLHNVRYEGHPPLWMLLLAPIAHLSKNPEWMKPVNTVISIAAAALVLLRAPLSLPVRLGFVFSYFMLFEYAVLDRNYMLGVLLLVLACAVHANASEARRASLAVPIVLALAVQTALPALVLACALFCLWLVEAFPQALPKVLRRAFPTVPGGSGTGSSLAARVGVSVLFAISTVLSLAIIRPPTDSGVPMLHRPGAGEIVRDLIRSGHTFTTAFLPLPILQSRMWNTSLFDAGFYRTSEVLGWMLFVVLTLYVRRPAARLFFLLSSGVLTLQYLLIPDMVHLRHAGFFFIALLMALWLDRAQGVPGRDRFSRAGGITLGALLAVQAGAGLFFLLTVFRHPVSQSKALADLIVARGLANVRIIGTPDLKTTSVLAYLNRDAYSLEEGHDISFVVWDMRETLHRLPTRGEMDDPASDPAQRAILITNKLLTPAQQEELRVQLLGSFRQGFIDDVFYLYH